MALENNLIYNKYCVQQFSTLKKIDHAIFFLKYLCYEFLPHKNWELVAKCVYWFT